MLRTFIVGLLCISMCLPNSPFWVNVAYATQEDDDGGEDDEPCSGPCDECSDSASGCAPADGSEQPETTCDPVHLRRGSVIESVIDLRLPGAVFPWSHKRTYDSGAPDSPDRNFYWVGNGRGKTAPRLVAERVPADPQSVGVEMILSATNRRLFKTAALTSPPDYAAQMEISGEGTLNEIYTLTVDNGEVLIFYGLNSSISTGNRGRLKQRTTREYLAADAVNPPAGNVYTYNSYGNVATITTSEPQTLQVVYHYTPTGVYGQVCSIEVKNDNATVIMKAEYWYGPSATGGQPKISLLDTPNTDLGKDGDLVQVKVSRLASDGASWIDRYTQYRYYTDTDSDGQDHQLKTIFEADAVQRAMDYSAADAIDSPDDILAMLDTDDLGSTTTKDLEEFASRSFTYYTSNLTTSSAVTPWNGTGEDLNSTYGAAGEAAEFNALGDFGAVRTETVGGACAACSGTASGIKRTYFYLKGTTSSTTDPNVVDRIVIEDTEDATATPTSPAPAFRRVFGLNFRSAAIREAFIDDPTQAGVNLKAWCSSKKLNSNLRVTEERMASAHAPKIADTGFMAKFFDPETSTNDTVTVSSTEGVVYYHEYDSSHGDGKHRTGTLIRKGAGTGSRYYVSATDWGDGTGNKPAWVRTATYTYPTKTPTRSDGKKTNYDYTFWDAGDTAVKVISTTLPAIGDGSGTSADQNGSNVATTTEQYFDKLGRLRWTVDGDGYLSYYSYNPLSGGQAYVVIDAKPGALPSSADGTGNSTKWVTSTNHNPSNQPTRDGTLPIELNAVTTREFDDQGRVTSRYEAVDPTDPAGTAGDHHVTRYFSNGTARFPYVVSSTATLPVQVSKTDDGGQLKESIAIDPSAFLTTASAIPTTTTDYVVLTKYTYDSVGGRLDQIDRYHDIGGTAGEGTTKQFYGTRFLYDKLGRRGATIQYVEDGKYQIDARLFDDLGRVIETRGGVSTSASFDYDDLDDPIGSAPPGDLTGYATNAQFEYDGGGVGDSHPTQQKLVNTVTTSHAIDKYTLVNYHRTFRGHVRGVERQYHDGTTADVKPYAAMDVDWMGRTMAVAQYTTEPGWSTLESGYDAWVNDSAGSTGRNNLTITKIDDLGRIYQTLRYPGAQSTKYFETNNYYDRRGNLVATEQVNGISTELAYDGAGRQYQSRTVKALNSTKYSSGAFDYVAPDPNPAYGAGNASKMTGGDAGVVAMSHAVLDAAGNATEQHEFENHDTDVDGIDLSNNDDYVRRSMYSWYDEADRLKTTVDYGSGDGNTASDDYWKYTALPGGVPSEPSVSAAAKLVTQYTYNADSGRLETVKTWQTSTITNTTKSFFDDLGRQTFVAENWVDFSPPSTNIGNSIGGGDEDRVTAWTYNGLGQAVTLTAHNGDSEAQETNYWYEDPYNASLVTHTAYPDSSSTPTSGTDLVTVEYNLDGSIKTRKDQRQTEIAFVYDSNRRLESEVVTARGGSTDVTVRAIKRGYDDLGRLQTISSYDNWNSSSSDPQPGGNIVNQIKYTYETSTSPSDDIGLVRIVEQDHSGAVDASTPEVTYAYDESADAANIFNDGLRLETVTYPDGDVKFYGYDNGTQGTIADRLNRVAEIRKTSSSGTQLTSYQYNGTSRLVETKYPTPDVHQHADRDGNSVYAVWDRFGRTVQSYWRLASGAGTYRDQFYYTFDYAGNRLTRDNNLNTTFDQTYAYDDLDRLLSNDESTAANDRYWNYDQLGNWLMVLDEPTPAGTPIEQRSHTVANELDAFSSPAAYADPAHDNAGNMTTVPQPNDPANGYTAKYDAWNRLVSLVNNDTDNNSAAYEYDGLHRRIVRRENTNDQGGSTLDSVTHFYYNENWQCLEERVGSSTSADRQYVWHPYYIDALAVSYRDANSSSSDGAEEDNFYLHDANFNVTAAVNSSGSVVERYAYTPYGEVTVLHGAVDADGSVTEWTEDTGGSDIGNEFLYTGRRLDPETGLQYSRTRYYHAPLGRFLTRDWIGYGGSPFNLYEYLGSMPTGSVDPMGLERVVWPEHPSSWCGKKLRQCGKLGHELGNWVNEVRECYKEYKEKCDDPCPSHGPGNDGIAGDPFPNDPSYKDGLDWFGDYGPDYVICGMHHGFMICKSNCKGISSGVLIISDQETLPCRVICVFTCDNFRELLKPIGPI